MGYIRASRPFPDNVKEVIDKVIAGNAYFAHAENILLTMLADERPHVRELAMRRILKARKKQPKGNIRIFRIPKINFDAQDYFDLIDWSQSVTEPPLTRHIPDEFIRMINQLETSVIKKFLCHTQAVERTVKVITDASSTVCGATARDGYIRPKLEARSSLTSFENKAQYYKAKNS